MATTLITSHASLKTVVADWLNRADLTDAIGNFIANAEDFLRRDPRVRNLNNQLYTIIQDKQEAPASMNILEDWAHDGPTYFGPIEMVTPGTLSEKKGKYGATGVPQWAAKIDGKFHFAPEPDTGGVAALQTLTFTANPSDTETVVIGSRTYQFLDAPLAANDVNIGSTQAASIANLVHAINDSGGGNVQTYHTDTTINTDVFAEDNKDGTVLITAKNLGDQGNVLATTETLSAGSWAAATMAGGVTPTSQYQTEITFWETLTALSAGTNWLVEKHPDIYLYATLLQSAPYLRDDPRLQTWGALLDGLLGGLGDFVDEQEFGSNMQRTASRVIG